MGAATALHDDASAGHARYTTSSALRLSVSADDVLYRVWPAEASSWTAVAAPMQHELTFSAVAAVTVP